MLAYAIEFSYDARELDHLGSSTYISSPYDIVPSSYHIAETYAGAPRPKSPNPSTISVSLQKSMVPFLSRTTSAELNSFVKAQILFAGSLNSGSIGRMA